MQETITSASQGLDFFNALTQKGAATALIVALVLGLGLAIAAKLPVNIKIENDRLANWTVYMTCIGGALIGCLLMWPPGNWRHTLGWSLAIAFATPLAWIFVVALVGLIRPQWKAALSLHRIVPEVPSEEQNEQLP